MYTLLKETLRVYNSNFRDPLLVVLFVFILLFNQALYFSNGLRKKSRWAHFFAIVFFKSSFKAFGKSLTVETYQFQTHSWVLNQFLVLVGVN